MQAIEIAYRLGFRVLYLAGCDFYVRPSAAQIARARAAGVEYVPRELLGDFYERCSEAEVSRAEMESLDLPTQYHFDERKPLGGSVDVETGLRYDASKGNFHLTAPKIDRLEVQGIPLTYRSQANAAVAKALEEFFARYPVYTLHNTDLKQLTTRLVLRDVNVTGGDLVLTLGI